MTAQGQIPNWNWESWTAPEKEVPAQWPFFQGNIQRVTTAASGQYAVKIQAAGNTEEIGALVYGHPLDDLFLPAGPFAARPDSVIAYLQYDIAAGDTAWVLLSFYSGGQQISFDQYKYTGSHTGGFERRSIPVSYSTAATPDSIFIGFTSNNPDGSFDTASYTIVDNISFAGTSVNVPNPDFEDWDTASYDKPDGWAHTGNEDQDFMSPGGVVRSADAYDGDYALRLATVVNGPDTLPGYLSTPTHMGSWGPAFPVSSRPDSMMFFAKYFPVNGDTASVTISLFKDGMLVGGGGLKLGDTFDVYTPFAFAIHYGSFTGTPDSAHIALSTYLTDSSEAHPLGTSVLYMDNMSFDGFVEAGISAVPLPAAGILVYPNPARDELRIALPDTKEQAGISILDLGGRVVLQREVMPRHGRISIGLSALDKAGMYILRIRTGNGVYTQRIVKY